MQASFDQAFIPLKCISFDLSSLITKFSDHVKVTAYQVNQDDEHDPMQLRTPMCATRKHVMILWSSIPFKIQSGYFPHRKINLHIGNQFIGSVIVCLVVLCNGQDDESTLKTRNFWANNSEKTGKLKETHRMRFTIDSNLSQAGKH